MLSTGAKIFCRTFGTAGLGLAMYDAVKCARHEARAISHTVDEDCLEKAYFDSRTIDNNSVIEKGVASKTFDFRMKNPLPSLWGKIKGATTGFISALGSNLVLVSSASLAIACKGFMAKVGMAGVIGTAIYTVARQGFGLGKNHPME